MRGVRQFVVFFAVWYAGAVLFDRLLGLTGPWMMCAGAITFLAAGWACDMFEWKKEE